MDVMSQVCDHIRMC